MMPSCRQMIPATAETMQAIGALVWGIGLGAVAIALTFLLFPLQGRAVAQPA